MSSTFLSLNPSKTEFLLVGHPQLLSKLSNPIIHLPNNITLSPVHFAPNLEILFNSNLTFSQHTSVSKSCFYYARNLRRIRNTIDPTTACTVAASLIHSKLDYCNSVLMNLPATQIKRLQLVLSAAVLAVTKTINFITFLLSLNVSTGSKLLR
jgi:hypothetical protein